MTGESIGIGGPKLISPSFPPPSLLSPREPGGSNGIPLPEVLVSKSHVEIRYSKSRKCFTVCDKGSRNGTIINDKRLSEVCIM